MSDIVKKIEKVKSFDKRIETLLENRDSIGQDSDACLDLVVEKAKYPQHYAEIVAAAAHLPLSNKQERLKSLAEKADQHPTQAGSAAWVLAKIGYADDAVGLWRSMADKFANSHPNLGAQMLAYGLIIDGAENEAQARIGEHKSANADVPSSLYEKPNISNQVYLKHLL
jgi:hypothetical protein